MVVSFSCVAGFNSPFKYSSSLPPSLHISKQQQTMPKRFKLRIFSQPLPFLCRVNTSSILPPTPPPPPPPLTPPSKPKPKGHISSSSTVDISCGCRSIPTINRAKPSLPNKPNSTITTTTPPWTTTYNSSISFDAAAASPGKQAKPKEPTPPFSTSSAETHWFSSEEGAVSTDSSFSNSATQFGPVVVTKKKKVKKVKLGWEVKRYGSKKKLTCPTPEEPETESEMTDERSFAVMKKTEDAYGDFKRSMMEMILENQMFDSGDLEQLLNCFLSLNSKQHYGVIIQAFSDIWEVLFSKSPKNN